jgi:hypothetical protein
MPDELSKGLRVGDVKIIPAGSAVGDLIGSPATGVVYPNAQIDTDVVMAPRATGAEVFWQLRSPRAGEEMTLGLALPEEAGVRMSEAGFAVVAQGDKPLTTISAPTAVDAQGRDVPVAMELSGEQLVLSIAHRDRDVAYPILIDPVIEDYGDPYYGEGWIYQEPWALSRLPEWGLGWGGVPYGHYIQRHHCYAPVSCDSASVIPNWTPDRLDIPDGLHIYAQHNPISYPAGSFAQFVYEPPGTTTQVEWADMLAFYHRRGNSQYQSMFTGIWSEGGGWVSIHHFMMDHADWIQHNANTQHGGRRSAVFGFYSSNNVMNGWWRDGYIGGALLGLTDPEPPTIAGGQMKRYDIPQGAAEGVWNDRDNATRWVKPEDQLAIRPNVSDPGLGVRSVKVTGVGVDNGIDSLCNGTKDDPCPAVWPGPGNQDLIEFDVNDMTDGIQSLTIHAWDPIIRGSTQAFPIKVDSTRPTIGLSGALFAAREDPQGSGTPLLGPGTHLLTVDAQDGPPPNAPGVATSGVEKVEVLIDGDVATTCPQNCGTTFNWNLDTAIYGGKRTVRVRVTDGAGNVASKAFVVNLPTRGELVLPVDGESTSSRLALLAEAREDGFSGVEFQYREMPAGQCCVGDFACAGPAGSSHQEADLGCADRDRSGAVDAEAGPVSGAGGVRRQWGPCREVGQRRAGPQWPVRW